jgi:hypothetical protein
MNCVVCGLELKTPASRNGVRVRIHEDCITENIEIAMREVLSPFYYKREDGQLMKGYFNKPHEEL